jgi:hypothetical protein
MRTIPVALVALLVVGCSSSADHGSSADRSASSSALLFSPTPTYPPATSQGPLTTPIPTGVTAIAVTLVQPGTGAKAIYGKTITDPSTMQQIISDVDGLRVAGDETQGCTLLPVGLQMDFTTATSSATFTEDSECARATLTIAGKTGPALGSVLLFDVEKLLNVNVTMAPDGQPSVEPG